MMAWRFVVVDGSADIPEMRYRGDGDRPVGRSVLGREHVAADVSVVGREGILEFR